MLDDYYGRCLTKRELPEELQISAILIAAMVEKAGHLWCQRCGTKIDKVEWQLPIGAYYCRACLEMGRVRSDEALYHFPQKAFEAKSYLIWQGELTPYQKKVSDNLVKSVDRKEDVLVHAVTGAGKTEMIYQVIDDILQKGQAVCIATPRVDVCIELYKRLAQDFTCPIALLHGEGEPYFRTPLVIATTHQLMRFYQAFDLLIIDEVDAFPYVDNAQLYHATARALKETGRKIFLTATSTPALDRQVKAGKLKRLSLPRRFHGNPLVVPQKIWLTHFEKDLSCGRLSRKLAGYLKKQRDSQFPLLIFLPEIAHGKVFAELLQKHFPDEKIGFVSSQTENRLELVQQFREHSLTILISTTILERGVTFPEVDVFVIEANHRLYTSSSLVQISGRVGRSLTRQTGLLLFFQDGTNRAIEKAIHEIKLMNKEKQRDDMLLMSGQSETTSNFS